MAWQLEHDKTLLYDDKYLVLRSPPPLTTKTPTKEGRLDYLALRVKKPRAREISWNWGDDQQAPSISHQQRKITPQQGEKSW